MFNQFIIISGINICNYILLLDSQPEVLQYKNLDLETLKTPVNVTVLEELSIQSKYDSKETEFLIEGFRHAFEIGYKGPKNVNIKSPNLKFREVGDPITLWNKVMKEVKEGRYAGPFEDIPFENYIQSPIGLVPKNGGKDTRLIFYLSYPRGRNSSVNTNTQRRHVQWCILISMRQFNYMLKLGKIVILQNLI